MEEKSNFINKSRSSVTLVENEFLFDKRISVLAKFIFILSQTIDNDNLTEESLYQTLCEANNVRQEDFENACQELIDNNHFS